MLTTPLIASPSSVAIGKNYAYTFLGDYVQLEADLTVSSPETSAVSLQLWACASPFTGGILQGVKVAEVLCDAMTTDTLSASAHKPMFPQVTRVILWCWC